MRPTRYPLESLGQLRDQKVEHAKHLLRLAVRDAKSAAETLEAREAAREAHRRHVNRLRAAESEQLQRGALRASDLSQADAWATHTAAQREKLVLDVESAQKEHHRAAEAERAARRELAARQADAKVVAGDRARWDSARRARELAREEEAAAEAWRPAKR